MSIEHHIADLNEFKESIKEIVNKFIGLSEKWHDLLQKKEILSQKRFAESDEETIKVFENNFQKTNPIKKNAFSFFQIIYAIFP